MPRAGDAYLHGQLPRSHDPLVRINYNPPKVGRDPVPIQDTVIGTIIELLTGVEDGDTHDLASWVNNLLRRHQPIPKVTSGIIGDENSELLLAPDFRSAGTIELDGNWLWTADHGYDTLGCVQVVAGGYLSELLSNEIPITAAQTVLKLSVRVKWEGTGTGSSLPMTLPAVLGSGTDITYTGTNPICMGVTRYKDREEVGSEDLAFVASPAGTSGWIELFDDQYEVPSDCDEIRLRFKIGENLTSGTVYWDNASVTPVGMGLIDKIVKGLENENKPGWNHVDLLLTMFNQFRTTADHASRITYLEILQSPGNKINDEFLRTGTTLGANWSTTPSGGGGGTWQTDGDYAFWNDSGFGDREIRARYIGSPSTTSTDTQQIIAVLGSRGEDVLLFNKHSYFDLYGRLDTGETNWIRARFRSDGVITLTRSLAGVLTDLATVTVDPLSAGATVILTCGTPSGARFFRIDVNGVAVIGGDAAPVSDSTSAVGAAYRGYGMGVRAEGSILILGQCTPPKINAWAAKDN